MNVVLIGSAGQCGIREYSLILMDGFRALGHRASYVGVNRHDNRDLWRHISKIERDDEIVVFEYEPGIFWLGGLIRAMAWLRFWRRKRVLLSVHEIAPEKYPEARQVQWHLSRPLSKGRLMEVLTLLLSTVDVALRFLTLRLGLLTMGWLPHAVLVHSPKAAENIHLAAARDDRVHYVPLLVKQLEGNRDDLRRELGLSGDRFAFIIPGFLFRRKRIIEVIEQLPPGAELWVVGTESEYDPGYLTEIQTYLLQSRNRERVRLIRDYERMERYLLAADVVVLFYTEAFQSLAAGLAIGAGKPCIFSDLPAFSDLCEAGLVVCTPGELRRAMEDIQEPKTYAKLRGKAIRLGRRFSPSRVADSYVNPLMARNDLRLAPARRSRRGRKPDLLQMVQEARPRLRVPVPLCKLCDLPEYNDPEWLQALADLGCPFDGTWLSKKNWEYAQLLYGLRRLECLKPDARVLSVGCGWEPHLFHLTNHVAQVVGIDLFEGEVENVLKHPESHAWTPYRPERLRFSRMDGCRLAFPDDSFDVVTSLSSIEHFGGHAGAARAMREVGRVLKPGGIAAIATELILSDARHPEFFSWRELHRYVIDPSELELIEPIDTSLSGSLKEHYINVTDVRSPLYMTIRWGGGRRGFPFTSVMLFMVRPSSRPCGGDAGC